MRQDQMHIESPVVQGSQITNNKFKLRYEAMKDENPSLTSNRVWDLVELPNGQSLTGANAL